MGGKRGLLLLLLAGCAGDLVALDGGYRHFGHGYVVGAPPELAGPRWKPVRVDGAALAYRRAGPQTMSLQSRCGRPVADPAIMARHLLIGLPEPALHQAGPVEVGGRSGWAQTFDTLQNGVTVRVKTVTLVKGDCAYDFALVGVGDFEGAERDFDTWWRTFRLEDRSDDRREER